MRAFCDPILTAGVIRIPERRICRYYGLDEVNWIELSCYCIMFDIFGTLPRQMIQPANHDEPRIRTYQMKIVVHILIACVINVLQKE